MPSKKNAPGVIVRGLPTDVTDAELALWASTHTQSPVTRAFVVRDKLTRASRGFGFVQFAFAEDASSAVAALSAAVDQLRPGHATGAPEAARADGDGSRRESRGIIVQLASAAPPPGKAGRDGPSAAAAEAREPMTTGKRGRQEVKEPVDEVAEEPAPKPAAAVPATADASSAPRKRRREAPPKPSGPHRFGGAHLGDQQRCLVLFGLPADYDTHRLWKRVRKTDPAGDAQPHAGEATEAATSDARKGKDGSPAVGGEHTKGHALRWPITLAGSEHRAVAVIRYDRKGKRDAAIRKLDGHLLQGHSLRAVAAELVLSTNEARSSGRVILRNIRFDVTADTIRAHVVECKVPPSFTHIHIPAQTEFAVKADAAKAVALMNESKLGGRAIAVDLAVSKDAFAAAAAADEMAVSEAVPASDDAAEHAAPDAKSDGDDDDGADAEPDDADDADDGQAADDDDASADAAEDDDDADDNEEEHDDDGDEDEDPPIEDNAASAPPEYKSEPVQTGTTLFLRNIPFDAADSELFELMKHFGPVRYTRLVMNPETGMSKGTAFVQYYAKDSADRALAAANASDSLSSTYAAGDSASKDPRERKLAAAAAAVGASVQEGGIKLKGRVLFAMRAVEREDAAKLTGKSKEAADAKKFDKRHTYLAFEGNVKADGEVASHMPKGDLEKRLAAQKDKKQKLQSPMFFVSPTRLVIRNLAKRVDDATLRKIAREAALAGWKEHLVDRHEGDPLLRIPDGTNPRVHVAKAKVIRESAVASGPRNRLRVEADGVTPRSKGFGFVEFTCHPHALACLRKLNNNPEFSDYAAGGGAARSKPVDERPRLIAEFAMEDWREVKKHQAKAERRAAVAAAGLAPAAKPTSAVASSGRAKDVAPIQTRGGGAASQGSAAGSARAAPQSRPAKDARPLPAAVHHRHGDRAIAVAGGKRRRSDAAELDVGIARALESSHDDAAASGPQLSRKERRRQGSQAARRAEETTAAAERAAREYARGLFGSDAPDAAALRAWL